MNRGGWLCTSLVALVMLGWGISRPAHGLVFHENLTFKVYVEDEAAPLARLYDSEDFQQMLLIPEDGPPLVLDLATESVYELAPEQIHRGEETVVDNFEDGPFVTMFMKEEGSILIPLDEETYKLGPAPPFIGPASLEELLSAKPVYGLDAASYEPDTSMVAKLRAVTRPVDVYVYFGTWCHLCKNLLPKFIKVVEDAGNSNISVHYMGVDEDMAEPAEWIGKHGVGKTPTLLFLEQGGEVGRIEEKAEPSVEAAMVEILAGR